MKRQNSSEFYAVMNYGIITQGTWCKRRDAIKTLEKEFTLSWKEIQKQYPGFEIIKVRVTRLPKKRISKIRKEAWKNRKPGTPSGSTEGGQRS